MSHRRKSKTKKTRSENSVDKLPSAIIDIGTPESELRSICYDCPHRIFDVFDKGTISLCEIEYYGGICPKTSLPADIYGDI